MVPCLWLAIRLAYLWSMERVNVCVCLPICQQSPVISFFCASWQIIKTQPSSRKEWIWCLKIFFLSFSLSLSLNLFVPTCPDEQCLYMRSHFRSITAWRKKWFHIWAKTYYLTCFQKYWEIVLFREWVVSVRFTEFWDFRILMVWDRVRRANASV